MLLTVNCDLAKTEVVSCKISVRFHQRTLWKPK